jgi:hypothetical protein
MPLLDCCKCLSPCARGGVCPCVYICGCVPMCVYLGIQRYMQVHQMPGSHPSLVPQAPHPPTCIHLTNHNNNGNKEVIKKKQGVHPRNPRLSANHSQQGPSDSQGERAYVGMTNRSPGSTMSRGGVQSAALGSKRSRMVLSNCSCRFTSRHSVLHTCWDNSQHTPPSRSPAR